MRIAIITTSDTRNLESDTAGQALSQLISEKGWDVVWHTVVTDDLKNTKEALIHAADNMGVDVILTCGGTGLSPRDNTPEATLAVADKIVPGIAEAIRQFSLIVTKRAMLSRGVSVLRGDTLIINVPGSKKAAIECFSVFSDQLDHMVDMMAGKGH